MLLQTSKLKFKVADIFYIVMMILPIVCGIVLQVLTEPPSTEITITGARIFFTIPMPLQDFPVTESQINSALVLITLFFFCRFITHGISEKADLKRQHIAELAVEKIDGMVLENMGEYFKGFSPFIIAILVKSSKLPPPKLVIEGSSALSTIADATTWHSCDVKPIFSS